MTACDRRSTVKSKMARGRINSRATRYGCLSAFYNVSVSDRMENESVDRHVGIPLRRPKRLHKACTMQLCQIEQQIVRLGGMIQFVFKKGGDPTFLDDVTSASYCATMSSAIVYNAEC